MNDFSFDIKCSKIDPKTLEVSIVRNETKPEKTIYNLDGKKAMSFWAKESIKDIKTFDGPQLSSGVKWKQNGRGKISSSAIGYIQNNANSPMYNVGFVSIFSGAFSGANGFSVEDSNFLKACAVFVARKSIKSNWVIDKDEYMAPDETHEDYQQWNRDAVVYALFNTSSNQSSLRDVDYKGKSWNIENQWFWMSVNDIKELANHAKDGSDDVWQDIKEFGEERYVYNKLQTIELSKDAKAILDLATKLVKDSFKYRKDFHSAHPEYQVNTWDAGWYQIKAIVKEYLPEELKKFNELYKRFEDRMRKGVYKFGFLKE